MEQRERDILRIQILFARFGQWEKVLRNLNHAIALVSADGSFIFANNVFQKLLGFTETELHELTWQKLTPDFEEADADQRQVDRVLSGEIDSYVMLKTYMTKAKDFIDIELQVQKLTTEQGDFLAFISGMKMTGNVHKEFLAKTKTGENRVDMVKAIKAEFEARPFLGSLILLAIFQWLAKQGVDFFDLVKLFL